MSRPLSTTLIAGVLLAALLDEPRFVEADEGIDFAGPTGALTQLDGEDGCVNVDGGEGCADGRALDNPDQVAVSPDGRSVYVTSTGAGAVAVFARDRETEALTQLDGEDGCVNVDGEEGCADGRALFGASGVAESGDGRNVYVASANSDAVAVFTRDRRTGALTQLDGEDGCVDNGGDTHPPGQGCAVGRALFGPLGVAVSGDGRNVYVGSSDGVAVFARDRRTGALTQLDGEAGCVANDGSEGCADGRALDVPISVAVSGDGKNVYMGAVLSEAVAVFARDRRTGALTQLDGEAGCVANDGSEGCADGRAVDPASLAVSGDGRNVYVASIDSDAVAVFARDRRTGALTQLDGEDGCVQNEGADGCADGRALNGPADVAVSRDGKNVYVASLASEAVAVFARDRRPGALTQLDGEDGCVDNDGDEGCADGRALEFPLRGVAVSRDGKSVYVAGGSNVSGAVAVFARERINQGVVRGRAPFT